MRFAAELSAVFMIYLKHDNTADNSLRIGGKMSASQKNYKVGIYVRLSRDDERQGESVSRYCEEQKWEIYSVSCDDGVSRTNFDRPGVQQLLEDAKDGKSI